MKKKAMRIFNKGAIELYAKAHAPAWDSLRSWYAEAIEAAWRTHEQVKAQFPKASIIANNHVVFDFAGNGYRLIVSMNYKVQAAHIKFFGIHSEYDRIDAASVDHTGAHRGKKDN